MLNIHAASNCTIINKVFMLMTIFGLLYTPSFGASESDAQNVMILPFEIHATEDLSYLSTQIVEVLSEHLGKGGATITKAPKEASPSSTFKSDTINKMIQQYDVDHIIWGSFTLIGEKFSLDAHMLDANAPKGRASVTAKGTKLENLLKSLKTLSEDISRELFHHQIVEAIHIQGNQRIESDAILRQISTQKDSIYQKSQVTNDLKMIYKMGFFDDLRVETKTGKQGIILIFHVKEKPTVRRVRVKGNVRFDDEKIKENLTLSTGAILNIFKVRNNMEQIEAMYKEKNYHQIAVDYKVLPLKNNQADIEFIIEEGPKVYLKSILFEGNKAFTSKQLKKKIKTSEKGFFFWITSSGDLDRTKLDQDVSLLNTFYSNQGYIRVKVADPVVDIGEEEIKITFKIEEGPQFKVGKVDVSGDLIKPKKNLLKDLNLGKSTYYNREELRSDIISLTDIYAEYGYAYADITPKVSEDLDRLVVDVTYHIKKKQEVYIENIFITGNKVTRDKVIRRELKLHETEKFNGAALKRSIRNLIRLNYFEDIKVDTPEGREDDQMVLQIDVVEKGIGIFEFGTGIQSDENLFLFGSVSLDNFMGKGQKLKLGGKFGSKTTRFNLSFTEPWLFDIPLSATAYGYNEEREYRVYDRNSMGGGLGLSYPILDYTRIYLSYRHDSSDVKIHEKERDDAADTILELEGTNITNSVSLALGYDSRDNILNPSEGGKHRITFEHAGSLGGDVGFNKVTVDSGYYFPLIKGLVGFVHGKSGIVDQYGNNTILPDYEKFYLGGINSIRGFGGRDIHLTKKNRNGVDAEIGGTAMVQFNFEIIVPISKKIGLMGVVFYDAGNVYDDVIELADLRRSAGYGIRWFSVLPIRIEYGYKLDKREGENSGELQFSMGGSF